ncbi:MULTISPECIES: hypothetical protein [Lachnospiraceae]|uniref:hypothetical protein n=1 Tax=Lachnospiraceae TaxID=186803 RepID=UPI00210EA459|nr:hypothetical protein [Blautia producta]
MHSLHKILVHIPDLPLKPNTCSKKELISEIRSYAEEETSSDRMDIYDRRETDSAGHWAAQYPVNVLFAKDNVERFIQELIAVRDYQHHEIQDTLHKLSKKTGTDLQQITCEIEKMNHQYEITETVDPMTAFYLSKIASLLDGQYTFHSCFYNILGGTSMVYPQNIEAIQKNPEDWALVLFDCHH